MAHIRVAGVRYSLADLARRTRNIQRSAITLREISPPAVLATDLFRSAYLPIIQTWEAAIPRIVEEYERTLSSLTTDAPSDVQAQIDAAQGELSRLFLELTPALQRWAYSVERWTRGRWRGAVLSATGVDISTLVGPEDVRDTLENVISWNTSLIRDVSDQARQRISNAVFSGLNERKPAREVAKDIREAVAMSRRRSIGIASDQLGKLAGSLADERRREAGILLWRWKWSHKQNGRAEHIARDGKIYADTAAGAGGEVEGQTVLAPPADRPSQLPYCGCRSQAVLTFD